MRLEVLRIFEAAFARAQNNGARQARDAACEMDDASVWTVEPWKTVGKPMENDETCREKMKMLKI